MIPVAANDVAFSTHAVLLSIFTLFQVVIYDVSRLFKNSFSLLPTCIVCLYRVWFRCLFMLFKVAVCDVISWFSSLIH